MISNFLGLRDYYDDMVIDPVLPKKLDGLTFDFKYRDKQVQYHYHVKEQGYSPVKIKINGKLVADVKRLENPYRAGGALIKRTWLLRQLNRKRNIVEVYI